MVRLVGVLYLWLGWLVCTLWYYVLYLWLGWLVCTMRWCRSSAMTVMVKVEAKEKKSGRKEEREHSAGYSGSCQFYTNIYMLSEPKVSVYSLNCHI